MSAVRPLVIGGGPAGSAAAIALAAAGARPLLIERSRETGDAICGGFLSWQTLSALERLGVGREALGGQRVERVRLFANGRRAEARLPRPGMGLSRRALDTLMMRIAGKAGTAIERGVTIRGVAPGEAVTSDGTTLVSDAIFLASGKHALPGQPRTPPARVAADPVLGLRLRIAPSPALAGLVDDAVELFLFDRGYAGLVRQEDGSGNLCLAVHKSRLAEAGGRPEALIAAWGTESEALGARLGAGSAVGAIDAIGNVPYGWSATGDDADGGLWRLGDQAGVIPSLAGEGMGIAVATSASAVAAWRRGEGSAHWQRAMAAGLRQPMAIAGASWHIAEDPRWNGMAVAMLARSPWLIALLARMTRVSA